MTHASAASWLPRGNRASCRPEAIGNRPSMMLFKTSSWCFSNRETRRFIQLLSCSSRTEISVRFSPSSWQREWITTASSRSVMDLPDWFRLRSAALHAGAGISEKASADSVVLPRHWYARSLLKPSIISKPAPDVTHTTGRIWPYCLIDLFIAPSARGFTMRSSAYRIPMAETARSSIKKGSCMTKEHSK